MIHIIFFPSLLISLKNFLSVYKNLSVVTSLNKREYELKRTNVCNCDQSVIREENFLLRLLWSQINFEIFCNFFNFVTLWCVFVIMNALFAFVILSASAVLSSPVREYKFLRFWKSTNLWTMQSNFSTLPITSKIQK